MKVTTTLKENGSGAFLVCFGQDMAGTDIVPTTATWTLMDTKGNIINSREDVTITPANEVTIVVYGDDLAITENMGTVTRLIRINGVYNTTINSVVYSGLPYVDEIEFKVSNLV